MKIIKILFHFFGSVQCAICLIGAAALFVIAGTLIESKTGSHLYAAYYTYQNPAFLILLAFFFINILFAALRRWPFKPRHIPFLITHLGLLMILAGVMIKASFGTQGTLSLLEGSGNDEILVPNTYAVKIRTKNNIADYLPKGRKSPYPELQIETIEYAPHSTEKTETWIKGSHGVIAGLAPFKVHSQEHSEQNTLPLSGRIALFPPPEEPWNLLAFTNPEPMQVLKKTYLDKLKIKIQNNITHEILYEGSFKNALKWKDGSATLQLAWQSPNNIYVTADLIVKEMKVPLHIPLTGPEALENQQTNAPYLGSLPLSISFEQTPSLILAQNPDGDTDLFAFDPHGKIFGETFPAKGLSSLIVYDGGWHGYYAQAKIPFSINNFQKDEILHNELKAAAQTKKDLSPPLQLLCNACQKGDIDFADCCTEFLSYWNKSYSWLYPLDFPTPPLFTQAAKFFEWPQEPVQIKNGCTWLSQCFEGIDPLLQQGIPPRTALETLRWPLPLAEDLDDEQLLVSITQQMLSIGNLLPPHHNNAETLEARALSAYLRAYGIHLSALQPKAQPLPEDQCLHLECPITLSHKASEPPQKWEDAKPLVRLKLKKDGKTEYISLAYDRTASGFFWPAFNGEYLLRFQPLTEKIPYRIRLRKASQINYPHSSQPYSYESDLLITDKGSQEIEEKTISMNHIHETWEGFRFYLAGLSPQDGSSIKRIQLVINHDPAKYWLTYPGGAILSLGILLLFLKRKHYGGNA